MPGPNPLWNVPVVAASAYIDPLAKPLVGLPRAAYYAAGAQFATDVNWLGWKMARSPRWHKMWWAPQVTSIAGNVAGFCYTRAHRITN